VLDRRVLRSAIRATYLWSVASSEEKASIEGLSPSAGVGDLVLASETLNQSKNLTLQQMRMLTLPVLTVFKALKLFS
jgi:hypothetical protein